MIIEYVKLKNYRQYKDEKVIFSKDKNFTILQGSNGVGKSNFFNAVNWCLYGKEVHLTKEDKRLPLLNTVSLKQISGDEELEVNVEIKMKDNQNKTIIILRSQRFYMGSDGEVRSSPSSLEMIREINKNMVKISDPSYIISRLMPEDIREYFFFDGERLDDYFKKEGAESIKKSVFKISQIDLLERTIDHLDEKKRDFLRADRDLTPAAESIRKEIDSLSKALGDSKKDLEEKEIAFKNAKKISKEILDKIKKNPILDAKELKERRIELDIQLRQFEVEIEEVKSNFEKYLLDIYPKILLSEAINKVKSIMEEKKKKKEFPPGIDGDFLKDLLKSKKCICGRPISEKDGSEKELKDILKIHETLSQICNELFEHKTNIEIILRDVYNFEEKYIEYEKKLKEVEKKREEMSKEFKNVKEKLSQTDESYAVYEEQLENINEESENTREEIGRLKLSIEGSESLIKEKNEDLEEELKKETKFNLLRKKLKFCQESLEECQRIKEEIMEDTKKEIEEKTRKNFFELIWNPTDFRDISIDNNYNLSVIHSSGLESIGSLSAGQRQVLALSFIAALNSISGFNLPIIIDTPLGRISKQTRTNIAERLSSFLKDKQVMLLVTDEEYTPDVRRKLEKNIGKEYEIKLKDYATGGVASIIEK